MKKNFFAHMSLSYPGFRQLLEATGYRCDAKARLAMAEDITVIKSRPLPDDVRYLIRYAVETGGCDPKDTFEYPTPHGIMTAKVVDLYKLPTNMVNPMVLYFSGCLTAPFYAMEAIRWHAKRTGKLLDSLSCGKEGNKGLFIDVFGRKEGIVVGTEYNANYNIMEMMAPRCYVRKHEREFLDTNTLDNLKAVYQMAEADGMSEVSLVLVTGQPWYDKRLLAEWMYELRKDDYRKVKVNLVLAHCPLWLNGALPEAHPSEILLGYIQASIGPLMKDTITFYGETRSKKPERYLMPDIQYAPWDKLKPIIAEYGNMGWPNYEEIIYDTPHKEAVEHIIIADLFARASVTPAGYDRAVMEDIKTYQKVIGTFSGTTEEDFLNWCKTSPSEKFFD